AIMMRFKNKFNKDIWNIDVSGINYYDISPEKALYWLTGGENEWRDQNNFVKKWSECALDFEKKFGSILIDIINNSNSLKDIEDGFLEYLNMSILYEFAL